MDRSVAFATNPPLWRDVGWSGRQSFAWQGRGRAVRSHAIASHHSPAV